MRVVPHGPGSLLPARRGACEPVDLLMRSSMVSRLMRDRCATVEQQSHFGGGQECIKIPAGLWILAFDAGSIITFGEMPDMSAEKFRGGKLLS